MSCTITPQQALQEACQLIKALGYAATKVDPQLAVKRARLVSLLHVLDVRS